jgi:hypothetical protein
MKTCLITLLALSVTSCLSQALSEQSTTPSANLGVSSFPIGTYTRCAQGTHSPSGNTFLNISGFQDGAVLTLAQSGTTVTSTYANQNSVAQSLSFSTTTRTSAGLARDGQVIPGFSGHCVRGPGNDKAYPATMTVGAGTLTYNAGTIFLALTGDLQSDAGACGTLLQPGASYWLLCTDRQGSAPASVDAVPHPVTQLPVGQYSCSTQVETFARVNGMNHYVAGGASGTLTLTADGAKVTGHYSGDFSIAGTLRFDATSPTTASVEAGQALMAPCMAPMRTGGASQTPEPLPIAAGALTLTDSTLFVSFAGTTAAGSSCPGAQVAGSLVCPRVVAH